MQQLSQTGMYPKLPNRGLYTATQPSAWRRRCGRNTGQQGITIVMLALFIVVLFTIAALAIDMGVLYTARTSAQHAADSAALAGAFTFTNPGATQPLAAENAAINIAATNRILGQPVILTNSDVAVDRNNRRVTVTVSRLAGNGIATLFARAMGVNTVSVQTRATAEASATGTASACLKPFFLPNTILSVPSAACGYTSTVFDLNHQPTQWALNEIQTIASGGVPVPIRPTSPSGALTPSQYYSLDFGQGANTFSCTIGQCLNQCGVTAVRCNRPYPIETGNMVGPTNQGINTLVGNPPDRFLSLGQYQTANGPSDTSQSLVIAPVWDNCAQSITPGTNGQTITVIGYLELFVTGMNSGAVNVYPIQPIPCSTNGGNPGAGTGPLAIPVRLVQNP